MPHPSPAQGAVPSDDVILLEWAVRYYDGLPERAPGREHFAAQWFADETIARLIDDDNVELLAALLGCLPARRFASFVERIATGWSAWPSTVAHPAARVLAGLSPEIAAQSFDRYLQQPGPWSFENAMAIFEVLDDLPSAAALPLARKLIPLAWGEDKTLATLIGRFAFQAAVSLNLEEELPRLFDGLLAADSEHRREMASESIAESLFAHDSYAKLFQQYRSGHQGTSFSTLAPLFETDAPLSAMDAVLSAQAPLVPAMDLLQACHDRSPKAASARRLIEQSTAYRSQQHPALLAGLALAAVACAFERQAIDATDMSAEQTASLLALDVFTNIHYDQLCAHLRDLPADQVLAALSSQLEVSKDTYGEVSLARVLGDLAWPEFTPTLIGAMNDDHGDLVCEAAQEALIVIGEGARDALIAQWPSLDDCQQIYGGSVLASVGGPAVADFALRNRSALLHEDLKRWCDLALAAPDQRLLEVLRPELRRNQRLIDRTYYCLCRLLDANCPELDDLRVKIMRQRESTLAMFERNPLTEQRHGLTLPLRCPACGTSNDYDVKAVVIGDPENEEMLVADEIACLSCGVFSEFEFGPKAKLAIIAETMLEQAAASSTKGKTSRLLIADTVESPDGSKQTIPNALASLREKIERDANDWRSWFRLSNVLRHINRPKAGLACLQQAYAKNSLSLDVIINLAEMLVDVGKKSEAYELLHQARQDSCRWHIISSRPEETRGAFVAFYSELQRQLAPGGGAVPAATFTRPERTAAKVGRNDPCPCGSGKKFKKCCLA